MASSPRLTALIAFALGLAGASAAEAQSLRVGPLLEHVEGSGSTAEYALEVEGLDALESSPTLQLVLPDGVFEARRVRAEVQPHGLYWQGTLHEAWPVLITLHRGELSGLIHTPWAEYEVVPGLRLAELDASKFPKCATDPADTGHLAHGSSAISAPSLLALGSLAPDIMDVLVVYTAEARTGVGGQAQIESTIQAAVNITNTAYENSQVNARLHLMHMEEAPFGDSGSSSTDLTTVRTSSVVQGLRDRYGADLVALIVNRNGACGRGYLQRVPGPGFASLAYQVTTRSCAVGNLSFAHEFGHNQGCEHDPANANPASRASFPYAFGHFQSGSYRTVMSYSNQCTGGCGRAPYFSNSNITHQGLDTGILDERENYRVINQTAGIVAAFRNSASTADFAQASWSVLENQPGVDVEISRSGLPDKPATIFVRPREDTARAEEDFPVFTATVSWAAGDTAPKTIRVPILDDRALEGSEQFELLLEEGLGVGGGTVSTAQIVIEDVEEGYVRLVAPSSPFENQRTVSVRVERFDGSDDPVSVDWALLDGTATAGADFVANAGTLSWSDGDTRAQLVEIELLDDTDVEGEETFVLALSGASGRILISTPEIPIVIQDYEEGAFSFAVTATSAREDAGLLFLPLIREGGTDGAITLDLAFDNPSVGTPATADQDFTVRLPSFVVPDGVATWPVPIELRDDTLVEGAEAFVVRLDAASSGARIGTPAEVQVTVEDWEEGQAQLLESALSVEETAPEAILTVTRANGSDGPATVRYRAVPGSAGVDLDFESAEGEIQWANGEEGPKNIRIPLLDDDLVEGNETFAVRLESFLGINRGARTEVEVTIQDREAGALGFAAETVRVLETESGTVEVQRSGGSDGEVGVRWRIRGGTAAVPSDVAAAEGTLTFADGRADPQAIPLDIIDDRIREGDEAFTVELSSPTGSARLERAITTVSVIDSGAGDVAISSRETVLESAGSFDLAFERSGEAYGPLTVTYRVVGGTAQPEDFGTAAGSVSWSADESGVREVRIDVVDDGDGEASETIILGFEASDPTAELSDAEATITILDDDDGCACTATEAPSDRRPLGALLLLGLLLRPRRRRRR